MKMKKLAVLGSVLFLLTGCSLPAVPHADKEKELSAETTSASEMHPSEEENISESATPETTDSTSGPQEKISVADVKGMTLEEGAGILLAQGFAVESEYVGCTDVQANTIVSQNPGAYDLLTPGEMVKLYVAEASPSPEPEPERESSPDSGVRLEEFPLICQYPELPTGCEITSLTMTLNYLGYPADRFELSDYYLKKGPVGTVNFYEAFEGDPRDGNSYGCYAPVIVNTANSYLSAVESSRCASNLTGASLWDLFAYVDAGTPVIVWATYDCNPGHYSVTWNVNGQDLTWYTPEHCLVLIGYDDSTVSLANPAYGDISVYDIDLFDTRYHELGCQAVVIQ